MNAGIRNHRTADPRIEDFYHDMNEHNTARYGRVLADSGAYVVELQRFRPHGDHEGSFTLTVWKAVESRDERGKYANPKDGTGNRYAWDAVGREEYRDEDDETGDAQRAFRRLKDGDVDVSEWCDSHPYEGPRSPWYGEENAE